MKLHIFDVDFTIVTRSTIREFLLRGLATGMIGLSLGAYAPLLFVQFRFLGTKGKHAERAYPFLRGVGRAELEALAASVFSRRILPRVDAAVADRIASIREAGGRVMIASSSFGLLIEPLARYLGIADTVASELEFEGGVTTGRLACEPAFGRGKLSRVLSYLRERGLDPRDCAFYSDSSHDLPLLRAVGQPVAVNPDRKLRRIALREGWELLETRTRGGMHA